MINSPLHLNIATGTAFGIGLIILITTIAAHVSPVRSCEYTTATVDGTLVVTFKHPQQFASHHDLLDYCIK